MGNNKNNINQSPDSREIYAAKLAFIGASISTLGDGLQAIAAGIALELLEKSNNGSSQSQNDQSKQTEKTQKQVDDLINELKQIKKIIY
ncbi:translation initiation factor 2 [Peribacillus sp. YIM B13472]|uniref:translation initiation factor 2 n=1 Tax=Peribacillus sp. YIM B13472 TaxID=3366297 RepID=UPI0036718773